MTIWPAVAAVASTTTNQRTKRVPTRVENSGPTPGQSPSANDQGAQTRPDGTIGHPSATGYAGTDGTGSRYQIGDGVS